jgi:hypothetical protein
MNPFDTSNRDDTRLIKLSPTDTRYPSVLITDAHEQTVETIDPI